MSPKLPVKRFLFGSKQTSACSSQAVPQNNIHYDHLPWTLAKDQDRRRQIRRRVEFGDGLFGRSFATVVRIACQSKPVSMVLA